MTQLFTYDGAQHRRDRLAKTLRIAREILAFSESQTTLLIYDLTDKKGMLTVNWSAIPTQRQCDAFAAAWELVGEKPDRVVHNCVDAQLEGWDE